jgi:23S rRNA (guanine745-N1)-methyltransferase
VLDHVLGVLRCPVCAGAPGHPADGADRQPGALARVAGALRCRAGHLFDVARPGYVNLLTGRAPSVTDTPAMVAARAELFDAGHLAPVTAALTAHLPSLVSLVLDVGAGTGHHLAAALDARPGSAGVALDISKAAAGRCARAHPAVGAVVADVWRRLPLVDGCVDVVLDVFAPRHGPEFRRVLRPDGSLLVVTPTPEHLAELVGPLDLVRVDPGKPRRVEESLGRWFAPVRRDPCRYGLELTRAEAARFVAMGPSAWHRSADEVAQRLAGWAEPVPVTVSVELTSYHPRH